MGEDVLGPLEREVMQILWDGAGPMSVRAVLQRLNDPRDEELAYTTAMTTLKRLSDKGMLRRHRQGRSFLYEPEAEDPAAVAVRSVIREFGDAALAEFVEGARADPEIRRRLREVMGEGG